MKKLNLAVLLFIFGLKGMSQIPQFINYQAIARYNNSNIPIPHQAVNINFKIRQGSATGDILFDENQSVTTDDYGLFNLKIGYVNTASFKQINWSTGKKFLEVTINGTITGVSELSSTPYALVADFAKSSLDWKNSGDTILYSTGKRIGIGTTHPEAPLDVSGFMRIVSDNTTPTRIQFVAASPTDEHLISSFDENGNRLWDLNFADRSKENRFALFSEKVQSYVFNVSTDGNVGIKTNGSPDYALSVNGDENVNGGMNVRGDMNANGNGSVNCLTIKGGCDWYEEANAQEAIQPGHVVVIDTKGSINSVKLSSNAYDRLVTGVVSGAGGINPGIGLKQNGTLEGNTKVAMGGKVKVYVTGEVKPGDLLTSSNKPGYAMAVKNRKKAFGAVLGKALSMRDNDSLVMMQVMMQ